jgi:endonuclease YncB( thermonuclease family)
MGVAHHLSLPPLMRRLGGLRTVAAIVGMIFGLGLAAGTVLRPVLAPHGAATAFVSDHRPAVPGILNALAAPGMSKPDPLTYPVEVVRVIDGDTFEARVRVWPGLDVNTKVRLRNIDAPELHARCAQEYERAEAARDALRTILAAGEVTIYRVGPDKYGGRIDAMVATRDTADVSAALLNGGWARRYDGGRRGRWC